MKYTDSFIKRYYQPLMDKIYKYAYENAEVDPYMERKQITSWSGKCYDVINMDKELHSDIIEDLKQMGMYYTIKSKYDKYVILPDIFSVRDYPLFKHRNEFDMGLRNIVMINGFVLELKQTYYEHAKYNHNGKLYYFYRDQDMGDIFNGNNQLELITVNDMGYIYDKMAWNWWEDYRLHLRVDANGKIIDIITGTLGVGRLGKTAILGASPTATDYIGVSFMAPFIEFKYGDNVDPELYIEVPGLMSFTEDGWVMEKTGNHDFNSVYIHNRNVLFSNTAIIIFKDETWSVENFKNGESKYISKIDKHTLYMGKYDNIDKVFIFTRPFNFLNYERVDTIYDELMSINSKAFLEMQKHKKSTTTLANLISNKDFTLEDAIEYGYKYDLDVLKVIQNYFKLIHYIPLNNVQIVNKYKNESFYTPKWIIPITNRMNLYPAVFINDLLICSDLKIYKSIDADYIILDPLEFMKRYDNFNYHDMNNYLLKRDLTKAKEFFDKYIKSITVILVDSPILENVDVDPKLYRAPIYHNELIYDKYIKSTTSFVNGRLNAEKFSYDINGNVSSKDLARYLDGIERFDYDTNINSFNNTTNPTKLDIYHPQHKLDDGSYSIYENNNDLSLLINRMSSEPLFGICKLYLGNKYTFRHNHNTYDTLVKFDFNTLKEKSTLCFDKYGILANSLISVLSSQMLNLTNAYNYKHHDELSDDVIVHAFSPKLVNSLLDVNFEIDVTRIDNNFNAGSFNDNVANDFGIQKMFEPNKLPIIKDIPITFKNLDQLYGEKVLTKYWLSTLGNPYDKSRYLEEIKVFNGKYISLDGSSLGIIPDINKDFIDNTTDSMFGTFTHSLNTLFASNSAIYKMMIDSNQGPIISIANGFIDLNKFDYNVNLSNVNLHYIQEENNTYIAKLKMNIDLPPQAIKS